MWNIYFNFSKGSSVEVVREGLNNEKNNERNNERQHKQSHSPQFSFNTKRTVGPNYLVLFSHWLAMEVPVLLRSGGDGGNWTLSFSTSLEFVNFLNWHGRRSRSVSAIIAAPTTHHPATPLFPPNSIFPRPCHTRNFNGFRYQSMYTYTTGFLPKMHYF